MDRERRRSGEMAENQEGTDHYVIAPIYNRLTLMVAGSRSSPLRCL